jgi:hypothetical protein
MRARARTQVLLREAMIVCPRGVDVLREMWLEPHLLDVARLLGAFSSNRLLGSVPPPAPSALPIGTLAP